MDLPSARELVDHPPALVAQTTDAPRVRLRIAIRDPLHDRRGLHGSTIVISQGRGSSMSLTNRLDDGVAAVLSLGRSGPGRPGRP
jgi:hypothetical protein